MAFGSAQAFQKVLEKGMSRCVQACIKIWIENYAGRGKVPADLERSVIVLSIQERCSLTTQLMLKRLI